MSSKNRKSTLDNISIDVLYTHFKNLGTPTNIASEHFDPRNIDIPINVKLNTPFVKK